jgi:integrase
MTEKQIKKEVERQAFIFEERCNNTQSTDGNVKFETLAEEWFIQVELEKKLKALTIKRLKQARERTYAAIGHLYISKITSRQIQEFINNLAEDGINKHTGGGLSTKTQKLYINFISDVFNYAINYDMDVKNPCGRVQVINKPVKERDCYTVEEAQHFLELLETAPLKYRAFFTLAIYGGFRRGELLGLEWCDIDFINCIVSINRTSLYSKETGIFTDTTKTKNSTRQLKLPEAVIQLLKSHKAEQAAEQIRLGDQWQNTNRIFTAWNGEPMGVDSSRHWLTKFCARNSIKYVNVHSFRHLNASLLIMSGVDIKTVSSSLGHSQASTTLNIYAHAFAEAQARASETIANALPLNMNDRTKKA